MYFAGMKMKMAGKHVAADLAEAYLHGAFFLAYMFPTLYI